MKKARHWLIGIQPKLRRWLRNGKVRLVLAFVLVFLTVRGLPYLAPIHAQDLVQDRLAVEFTDRNGLQLGTLLTRDQEHTAVVPLDRVSSNFIQAILAAEDGRFYQHGALDLKATCGCAWR